MQITKRFTFDAAHRLPLHHGKCRNLHGHHYTAEIRISGEYDQRTGMVLDFQELKPLKEWIDTHWDHAVLLDVSDGDAFDAFARAAGVKPEEMRVWFLSPPTAENMARHLFWVLHKILGPDAKVCIWSIEVWETPTCSAKVTSIDLLGIDMDAQQARDASENAHRTPCAVCHKSDCTCFVGA